MYRFILFTIYSDNWLHCRQKLWPCAGLFDLVHVCWLRVPFVRVAIGIWCDGVVSEI